MASTVKVKVLALIWEGMDILDFVGPSEVFSLARDNAFSPLMKIIVASDKEITRSHQQIGTARDLSIEDAMKNLDEYDILLVPGGVRPKTERVPNEPNVKKAIRAFSQLPPRQESEVPRTIMSVCSGAYLVADQGLFRGKTVTTHHDSLAELQKLLDEKHGGGKVVRQHYVDGGLLENKVRILSAGGVSSGIDAAFYLTEQYLGIQTALKAETIMEGQWRREALPFGFAP